MSEFFKVEFSHSAKDNGKYKRIMTVYHLHDGANGFNNHRCEELPDGKYVCNGCKETFTQENINHSPKRQLSKNKSYWLELWRSGQHLPHNEKDIFWTHIHPEDDVVKRKAANVDSMGLFATCPACEKTLNLHTWQESNPHRKQLLFPGIISEKVATAVWREIKIFIDEAVEIWLQDENENFFFLNEQFQLLVAENQDGILVCEDRIFLDNDDRKCLLFQINETVNQALIDKHLKETQISIDEDFHLEIKMAEDDQSIALKPEPRHRSETQELASGELTKTDKLEEEVQKIIIIVNDEASTEMHEISSDLQNNSRDDATPLPKESHPLLDIHQEQSNDNTVSGTLELTNIVSEPTMDLSEAPTIVLASEETENIQPNNTDTNTTTETELTQTQSNFSASEDEWFNNIQNENDESPKKKEENLNAQEKVDAKHSTITDTDKQIDETELTGKKDENSAIDKELPCKTIPNNQSSTIRKCIRKCIICAKTLQSSPLTGMQICEKHEKQCAICATINPKEAMFCGGCKAPFTKKVNENHETPKSLLKKIGLIVGSFGGFVLISMLFAWIILNYSGKEANSDKKQVLAEKYSSEKSSMQNTQLSIEMDQINIDLINIQENFNHLKELLANLTKEKKQLLFRFEELERKQESWQKQERERNEKRYTELLQEFKKLASFIQNFSLPPPSQIVNKGKNSQARTKKIPQKHKKKESFEAKDLVHIWNGPSYF